MSSLDCQAHASEVGCADSLSVFADALSTLMVADNLRNDTLYITSFVGDIGWSESSLSLR